MNVDSQSSPNPIPIENIWFFSTKRELVAPSLSMLWLTPHGENGCFCLQTTTSPFLVVCPRTYG